MLDEEKADWGTIVIHFICGLIVGALFTFSIMVKTRFVSYFSGARIFALLLCISVGIGTIYALYQNELWNKGTYSIIPPLQAQHSKLSRMFLKSLCVLAFLGAILAFFLVK